jgi:hypothetical protein
VVEVDIKLGWCIVLFISKCMLFGVPVFNVMPPPFITVGGAKEGGESLREGDAGSCIVWL